MFPFTLTAYRGSWQQSIATKLHQAGWVIIGQEHVAQVYRFYIYRPSQPFLILQLESIFQANDTLDSVGYTGVVSNALDDNDQSYDSLESRGASHELCLTDLVDRLPLT